MSKQKKSVTVTFRSPSFTIKGQKYISKDIEAAAEAGDESAQLIIAELVNKGSGVITVQEDTEGPAAPKKPKAEKKPKAPKATKADKAPKVDTQAEGTQESEKEKEDKNA